MRPAINPRLGTQRQKSVLQKLAQQAIQRKGLASKVGRFGKLGVGRGAVGALSGARSGAKPFGSMGAVTPKGLDSAIRIGEGWVSANPPSVGATQLPSEMPGAAAPEVAALPQYSPGDTIPAGGPQGGPGGVATSDPEHNAYIGGWSDIDPFGGFATTPQTSPASPITTPGGLVPLGGGIYYEPISGQFYGAGGAL